MCLLSQPHFLLNRGEGVKKSWKCAYVIYEWAPQVNYCDPFIWYTAHIVVNAFWVISAFGVLMICAGISRFCRSEESRYQPIILGTPSKKEIEKMKKIEDIQKFEKDLHSYV